MGMESSSDGFKEADDVADGMIPDSQIVHMINQLTSARDAQGQRDETTAEQQPLVETVRPCEAKRAKGEADGDEPKNLG
jgi:hypothetical protein